VIAPPRATDVDTAPGGARDGPLQGGSRLADQTFRYLCLAAGLLVLIVLGLILISTGNEAMPAFREVGFGFLTNDVWNPPAGQFGALPFIYGTLVASIIALLIAVPISLGLALFITELAPKKLRTPVVYLVDLLAAVPSVVYGLWGILVFGDQIKGVFASISRFFGDFPVIGGLFHGASGRSFMTAGIILAIMITPIITSLSREVIATVPSAQREAAYGMGATRWEMIRSAVMPWSRGGIVGSVMLGLGRAMGETIAVALVIGSFPQITTELFEQGDAMAAVVANQFGESSGTHRAALVGMGVVLFGLTILVNVSARAIVGHFDRRSRGA
jgi:phosphate transport system permease protein